MIYKPFFRDDLGYKPRYTQPLHLEEVVVSPIYDSENEDSKIDINSLGYKPVYKNIWEGVEINPSKKESVLSYTFQSKEDFKNAMIPIYTNILSEKGLNPLFAKSLVAQDGLESAWGSKPSGDNNFGGIKGKGRIKSTREVINGKDIYLEQEFRNFNSLEDYARYKVNLLNSKRYKAFDGELEDFSRRVSSGGYATDPRYKEILDKVIKSVKKGGRIEKASLGTIFPTNDPRGQRRSGVDTSKFYYNVPIETAYTKPKTHNYKARRSYDLKQVSDSGDLYYNIIHNRTNDAKDALIRNGLTKDIDFLKQILALQSIRETGWVDRVENNNYGGYTKGEGDEKVKLTFPSAEAFWDHHINNLNNKWGNSNVRGAWYESNSLEDYINRINNPDLNTTKRDYDKYNYNRRLNGEPEQYLYAPIWDNKGRNYFDDIKEVVDRYFYYYNN